MFILFVITYILSASFNLALCIHNCSVNRKYPEKTDVTMIFLPIINVIVSIGMIVYGIMLAVAKREKEKEGAKK